MAQSVGTQEKGSVNIELNIVPFIDLMSCLAAFLLITAVWVNLSSLENEPAGKQKSDVPRPDPPKLTILIESDQILVAAVPSGEGRRIGAFDWPRLEDALREFKTAEDLPAVEIAADSTAAHPIAYQQLIAAMDTVVKVGYPRVGITDPSSLAR